LTLKKVTSRPRAESAKKQEDVKNAVDPPKAKALFCGMFGRNSNNVQKGRFGQAPGAGAYRLGFRVRYPPYIKRAIEHVCGGELAV
jgi:hypothetical protein